MSPGLVLLLLLWEISCTWYHRYHRLPLSIWLLQNNAVSSFPKPGNFFPWWSAPRARRRLWPWPPDMAPLHDNNKWTRLWRSTGTSSPHPQGCLYTVRSSTPLTWPQVRHYPMDRSIGALFWRMMKSRGRFRSCCKKVTSGQVHRPVGARSCWYKRRMGLGDFVLTIEHWKCWKCCHWWQRKLDRRSIWTTTRQREKQGATLHKKEQRSKEEARQIRK